MTTEQSRLPDPSLQDGTPALLAATGGSSPRARLLRLRLAPDARGALDGAWWPYSRDLEVEAGGLVDQFPGWFDRITLVAYATGDWDQVDRQAVGEGPDPVGLEPFSVDAERHLVLLTSASVTERLRLLVVPPGWHVIAARHAMRLAASPKNDLGAAAVLERSRRWAPIDLTAPRDAGNRATT